MQTFTRVIGFGDALQLAANAAPGKLNAAVKRIHAAVGPHVGNRNTFAKLFELVDVPAKEKDRERAWLLLLALAQDPAEWGMGDYEPPAAISQESLRDLGISASRCTRQFDFAAA